MLATNVPYTRFHGGANRSNRALVEALAALGHQVLVVTPALASPSDETFEDWRARRIEDGDVLEKTPDGERFRKAGVDIHAVADPRRMLPVFAETVAREKPDWILVASEDPSQTLLAAALDARPDRVVYLGLTPQLFPFGPESLYPGEERTRLIRKCRLRLVLSRAAAAYFEQWAGVSAEIYTPPHFGRAPYSDLGRADGPALLINASEVKGLSIFTGLAKAFPDRSFAALPGYATTSANREEMGAIPNIEMRANKPSLDDVLAGVSVVLMPSLWFESFGMAAVDSMLRGIPVLAADHGALPEALLGTRAPLPVRSIEGYRDRLSENLLLEPVIPSQDIGPWREALAELWRDPTAYEAESRRVAGIARNFVEGLNADAVEKLLVTAMKEPAPVTEVGGGQVGASSEARAPGSNSGSAAGSAPGSAALSPTQKAQMLRRLRGRKAASGGPGPVGGAPVGIPRAPRGGSLPLSPGQRRLYFLQRLEPDSAVYNTSFALRLTGRLDPDAMTRALDALIERHEVLRSAVVEEDSEPCVRIAPASGFPLDVLDVADLDEAERVLRVRAGQPFDLAKAPLARACLARISPDDHVLLVTIHHIVTDAWSTGILVQDLAALYTAFAQGETPSPAPDGIGFVDYAAWQAGARRIEAEKADEDYWVARLEGAPTAINLPSDRPRPAIRRQTGDSLAIDFDPDLSDSLARLARERGATLFMVMLTAWLVVLHRLCDDEDIVIGIPVANRSRAETERVVGFFINTLPLRLNVTGNPSFEALIDQVRDRFLEGFEHGDAAFERVVERLNLPRSRSHAPLVQTLFGQHNAGGDLPELPGLTATPIPLHNGTSKFDLNVELAEADGVLEGSVEFDTELFERATVERMVEVWRSVLEGMTAQPASRIGSIPLLSKARSEAINAQLNPVPVPLDEHDSIAARIRASAARTPQAEALRLGEAVMTYAEFDRRTERLAEGLAARGVGPDVSVAFATERGFDRIVIMVAVFKAGGVCVPLDLVLPRDRLRLILENSGARFVLSDAACVDRAAALGLPVVTVAEVEAGETAPLPARIPHDALAYILYTSGSTGVPKGVGYPHGAQLNLMLWFVERFPVPARSMQFASIGFDASFNESLSVLMTGGCLNLLTEAERGDVIRAVDLYIEQGIERATMSVVLLNLLAERILRDPPKVLALREILATGEQLKVTPAVDAMLTKYPHIRLFNDYGPTESNVVTALDVTGRADHYGALPPIGRPVTSSRCYVLDRYLHPVPEGLRGELYLAGAALARGYNGRPALTGETFMPDPISAVPGERMYRSGDIARLRADGALELIGRADDQLKIRGFRVEPAEVEVALRAHPAVGDCLVIGKTFPGDDRRLVAYVIPMEPKAGSTQAVNTAELREYLGSRLPDYMVPAHVVALPAFELNVNGKIDRSRLPMPKQESAADEDILAPRTEIETVLLRLWQDVLDVRKIDIRDDFFSLGGHSLLIIRIIAQLREELGVELPLTTFLDGPTIEQLAVSITALMAVEMAGAEDEYDLEALLSELEGGSEPAVAGAAEAGAAVAGTVLDATSLRQALLERGDAARSGPGIAAIGVPSSNRPESLKVCLASYLENAREYGHRPDVVVCGSQGDPATDEAYRTVLGELAGRYGVEISYSGASETRDFAAALAARSGVDPAIVDFALSDSEGVGLPYGTNRNALLLRNAGRTFVSVDDDTRGDFRRLRGEAGELVITSESGILDVRVMASRGEVLAGSDAEKADWLGRHGEGLGADLAALVAADPERPINCDAADPDAFRDLMRGEGRIALTYQGWVGDSGWAGTEDARWLTGPGFDWMTERVERYTTALASRELIRGVAGMTVGRGGDFFCLSAGFDARLSLVPFLPVQRREDAFFGWLSMLVDGTALTAHLPGMVLHDRQSTGSVSPVSDPIDLAGLLKSVLARETDLPEAADARLRSLGSRLRDRCSLDVGAFDGWLRELALADMMADFDAVEARIAACPADRSFWARDAEIALQLARHRLSDADSHLPRSLGLRLGREERLERVRDLMALYGRLMEAWPDLMSAAADMRAEGDPSLVSIPAIRGT
jgi:amino acid adenylation domain-containing protein